MSRIAKIERFTGSQDEAEQEAPPRDEAEVRPEMMRSPTHRPHGEERAQRASRTMGDGHRSRPWPILRDARLARAPQDEVFETRPCGPLLRMRQTRNETLQR